MMVIKIPFSTIESLPDYVKKYPEVIQRMFLHVWNTTFKKLLKEGVSSKDAELRAFKAANGTIKKRMESFGASKYDHNANFNCAIDKFLNNF